MMVLQQACKLSTDPKIRFAALVHDFGKGTTPKEEWPKHIAHEERGVSLVEALCQRQKIPKAFRDLAVLVTRYHLHFHRVAELRPGTLLETLQKLDAFRRPDRFEEFLLACEADSRGRTGFENKDFEQAGIMRAALQAANEVDIKVLTAQGLQGEALGQQIIQLRIKLLQPSNGSRL